MTFEFLCRPAAAWIALSIAWTAPATAQNQAAAHNRDTATAESKPASSSGVNIPMDDRALRAAGISTVGLERERNGTDLVLSGTVVVPQHQLHVVAAPAAGLVETMLIAADEPVEPGQALARLRSPAILEAQRDFLIALSDESLSRDKLRRAQLLFEGRAIPERDWQVAQTEAAHARSRLDERTQVLSLMEMTPAEIEDLRETRKLAGSITIKAATGGTVTKRHASAGERVDTAGALFTIARLDPLWVNIQVPAARLANLAPGATISLPALGVDGKIIRVGRTVDANTQSAIAIAEIAGVEGRVRPGLAVGVVVHIDAGTALEWSVPASAVVRHRDRSWVFLRKPDGFVGRPVQVIGETARGLAVRADFATDDKVAVRGILSLLTALNDSDQD